jgi:hypothetical protein
LQYFRGDVAEVAKYAKELGGSLPKKFEEPETSGADFYKKFA